MCESRGHPTVTVIVCTYNRSTEMVRAVHSIVRQDLTIGLSFEVIVVDDGSGDNTAGAFADHFSKDTRVRYVYGRGGGYTTACNDGIRAARGGWLAFCDDDQEPAAGWLQALYGTAVSTGALFVGGPIAVEFGDSRLRKVGRVCRRLYGEYSGPNPGSPVPLPPGGNRLVARQVIERLGLYDERIESGGADLEFALRAKAARIPMAWAAEALMLHHVPPARLEGETVRRYAFHSGYSRALVTGMAKGKVAQAWEGVLRLAKASSLDLCVLVGGFAIHRRDIVSDQTARVALAFGYATRMIREMIVVPGKMTSDGETFRALLR